MAEVAVKRPETVATIPFTFPGGMPGEAPDLNDVVRQILWDLKEAHWETWDEAAEHLGITKAILHDFLRDRSDQPRKRRGRPIGMSLTSLSKIVGTRAQGNPVQFFQLHERFRRNTARDTPTFPEVVTLLATMTPVEVELLEQIIKALRRRPSAELTERLRSLAVLVDAEKNPPKKR